jgi:hypothetical protein
MKVTREILFYPQLLFSFLLNLLFGTQENCMKKHLTIFILIFVTVTAIISGKNIETASDNLRMNLKFENEILYVNAVYQTSQADTGNSHYFLLNPGFKINSIRAEGLKDFKITQKEGRPFPFLLLSFDKAINPGQNLEIKFDYEIDLAKTNHIKSDWLELNVDKLWFPKYGDIDTKFTSQIHIENLPADYSFVSYRDSQIRKNPDNSYDLTIKKAVPEVLILAGKKMKLWNKKDGKINVKMFAYEETPEEKIDSIYQKVLNSIKLLNKAFGQSKPIKDFSVVLRRTTNKELNFQFERDGLIVTGTDFDSYANLSHEIAHYWWNKADFIKEPWLNESFANYSMYLVLEEYDKKTLEVVKTRHQKISEKAPPVAGASLFSKDASNSYYSKGAYLLFQLENKIGRKQMFKLLSSRVSKKLHTTDKFLNELEKIAGKENRVYFEDLLNK